MKVKYLVEQWSMEEISQLLPSAQPGDEVDCGEWDNIEHWATGALPGTYLIESDDELDGVTVIIGDHPAISDNERARW